MQVRIVRSHCYHAGADIGSAVPQDSTPQTWDNNYYSQTQAANRTSGVGSFESDANLARPSTTVGEYYTEFAEDRGMSTTPCG